MLQRVEEFTIAGKEKGCIGSGEINGDAGNWNRFGLDR
jgi:hypothetical protein